MLATYNAQAGGAADTCKVTVVVPVFNMENYLAECLESVLSQTLREIEIFCVNDGSSDSSEAILYQYAVKDRRIRIVSQNNCGVAAARNRGIAEAEGKYIAFLDPDDYYPSSDSLEKLYTAAEENAAKVCGGCFSETDGNSLKTQFEGDFAGYTFAHRGFVRFADYQFDYGFHRFLYRADFLRGQGLKFPDYSRYQDPPFMARALAAADSFYALGEVTYCYRTGHKQVGWTVRKVCDFLAGLRENLSFSAERGYERLHLLNWKRLNSKFYFRIIVDTARKQDVNGEIVKSLASVQAALDARMIGAEGKGIFISAPLERLIDDWVGRDALLREEGWFIRRKLFRLYTWPVRKLGLALRKLKKRKGN